MMNPTTEKKVPERMTDSWTEKKAEEWSDEILDPEEEFPEADEETYRDGSTKNECWAGE